MLLSILPVPFADAGRQRQYEAVRAALHAEADAPPTVLLGNLAAFSDAPADALIVRPGGVALLVLVPRAGCLTVPTLTYGSWQLDGQPLPGREASDNPFAQYQQQVPPVLAWLREQLEWPARALPPCLGLALFEAPLTFGPGVEAQLHRHPAAREFELVGTAAQVPARLRQPLGGEAIGLRSAELLTWGQHLANELCAPPEQVPLRPPTLLAQKLRQLWRWLGAEDIPADPPYGGPLPDLQLRDQQEQARLRQLRQELQAELHQQRQEAAAREAARTQELALLRQQLAQAGPSASERRAEEQAKADLEESLRAARTELSTRNQELAARIQQLGQLIEQLQAAPAALPPGGPALSEVALAGPVAARPTGRAAAGRPKPRLAAAPQRSFRRLRQAERWGLVALAWAGIGAGTWGVVRWAQRPAPRPAATVARRQLLASASEGDLPVNTSFPADSLGNAQTTAADTLTPPTTEAVPTTTAAEAAPTIAAPEPPTTETAEPAAPTPAATEPTAPAATSPTPAPEPTEPDPSPTP